MAFSFGNMLKSMGHNFAQNMRGGGGPVTSATGGDITSAFGPQAGSATPQWGQMSNHDRLSTLGDILGGDKQEAPTGDGGLGSAQGALSAFLSRIGAQGAPAALPEPMMRPRGPQVDPNQPVIPRRFGFGGR